MAWPSRLDLVAAISFNIDAASSWHSIQSSPPFENIYYYSYLQYYNDVTSPFKNIFQQDELQCLNCGNCVEDCKSWQFGTFALTQYTSTCTLAQFCTLLPYSVMLPYCKCKPWQFGNFALVQYTSTCTLAFCTLLLCPVLLSYCKCESGQFGTFDFVPVQGIWSELSASPRVPLQTYKLFRKQSNLDNVE